jgi:lipopolysaccharide export system permease protein
VKIFTRYMALRFLGPFFVGLGMFALLIFLGDMFDKMGHLVKSKATLGVIVQYLWLEVPYWTIRVIPMATLLATLTALTSFVQSGEWIAVQACGFETKDFWKPILWCALAVTVLSFAAQETVLPACYRRARQLWQDQIHPEWEWDKYFDIALIGEPGQFIQAAEFRPKDGKMERPLLERIGRAGGVQGQLDAKHALWDAEKGLWVFHEGVERVFAPGVPVKETAFERRESDLTVPPRNLVPRTRNPDEMSLREMKAYAERMQHMGVSARELRVAAYTKVAYPFVNLIICALGIPVAMRLRKAGKAVTFFAALAVSFLYLWVIEVGRALGNSGTLAPSVAAWAANVVFGAAAVYGLTRAET